MNKLTYVLLFAASSLFFGCAKTVAAVSLDTSKLAQNKDATQAVYEALRQCKQTNAHKLIIPNGTYNFYPDMAYEKYCMISNNDNGAKRIAFPLINFKNLEIDANGSEFIFHGQMVPFLIEKSSGITLKGFSIDWDQPFNFQAIVTGSNAQGNSFDIKVYEECKTFLRKGGLYFSQNTKANGKVEGPTGLRGIDPFVVPWIQNLEWNLFFDSKTKAVRTDYSNIQTLPSSMLESSACRIESLGANEYRLYNAAKKLPEPSMVLVSKGKLHHNRQSPAIVVMKSSNLSLQNINIYHAGAMGLICERTDNVELTDFNVCLREGSDRMVTTTADATHFVGCRGKIRFKDCLFENMLDDATNVHGIYVRVLKRTGNDTLMARIVHFQQHGHPFAEAGDLLGFSSQETLIPYAQARVKSVNVISGELMEITFEKDLDNLLTGKTILENLTWQADLEISNCTVRNNRARSILVTSAGKVVIKNNLFERSSMMNILLEGDAFFWHESGSVRDVEIVGNRFVDLNPDSPSILISPKIPGFDELPSSYHKNIRVEDNVFEIHGSSVFEAKHSQNLIFKNNTIKKADGYLEARNANPALLFNYCQDIIIEDNKYQDGFKGVVRHDKATKRVVVNNNTGLE